MRGTSGTKAVLVYLGVSSIQHSMYVGRYNKIFFSDSEFLLNIKLIHTLSRLLCTHPSQYTV